MNIPDMSALCKDCLSSLELSATACHKCGGHRVISHPMLTDLYIAHMDCDAFFAAIEKRDDPSLEGKPVIVGGGTRGVVSTCCYIARLYGIHSAMPMFKALKACPDVVVVRPNMEKYSEAAAIIRSKMEALTPLYQPVSIDEAYMDLSGTSAIHNRSPAESLLGLANEIERDVGITVSIGLASNKFLAKTASELDKPRGFAAISTEEAPAFLAPYPIDFLHGVGKKFAAKLKADRFDTIGDLQETPAKDLMSRYGETGFWLSQRAFGIDNRPVRIDSERKSVSAETTFSKDLRRLDLLEDSLWSVCLRTADRAKSKNTVGNIVTLKLKTSNFKSLTRRVSLHEPTQLAQTLFRATRPLLAKEVNGDTAFRLIGVGISELSQHRADATDLLDPLIAKRAAAERASDAARARFGKDAVITGRAARMMGPPKAKD